MEPGDWATWVGSLGSILALIFAAIAAVQTFRLEIQRDRTDAADEHSRAARHVSAWWGTRDGKHGLFVRNGGDAPAYQVHLTVMGYDDRSPIHTKYLPLVPPGDTPEYFPVGELATFNVDEANQPRVAVSFTDPDGARWKRSQFGKLEEYAATEIIVLGHRDLQDPLRRFDTDFRSAYSASARFEHLDGWDNLRNAVLSPSGAPIRAQQGDVLIGPHDWIGEFEQRGIIQPIVLPTEARARYPEWALAALSHRGSLLGIPMTVDTVALLWNCRMASDVPPATFEELAATGFELVESGAADRPLVVRCGDGGDAFQLSPLYASAGGELFGRRPDGSWEPEDVRVGSALSIQALARFRELGPQGSGLIDYRVSYDDAFELFLGERTPYLVTTADGLERAVKAGLDVRVAAVPPFADGFPATPFASMHGLTALTNGRNQAIAVELFSHYLARPNVMKDLSTSIFRPVALDVGDAIHPGVSEYRRICATAAFIPTIPEMANLWSILSRMQLDALKGGDPTVIATEADHQVREVFRRG